MFEITAKERIGGEMKCIGYLPDTHIGGAQKGFCLNDNPLTYVFHREFPGGLTNQF